MGFEPIRLLQRISSVALSPPIPTLQALPGATMFDVIPFDLQSIKNLLTESSENGWLNCYQKEAFIFPFLKGGPRGCPTTT
jgi:hypothetical protein